MEIYGVGTGKSGTTTLARMFAKSFRAAHEADLGSLLRMAAEATEGRHDPAALRAALRARREELQLEVDVAAAFNPMVAYLVEEFPTASFIVTIRHCLEWLESRIDQRAKMRGEGWSTVGELRAAELRVYGDTPYGPGEQILEELGLPPVAGLLRRWADANHRVLEAVPAERLLVVRTEDIDDSVERIATFAGCAPTDLVVARANQRVVRTGALERIDPGVLRDAAERECRDLMVRFWGEDWDADAPWA